MTPNALQLSEHARRAVRNQDWRTVAACANSILQQDENNAEGYFLTGLLERVSNKPIKAAKAFEQALKLDENRYDAAVELANQYSVGRRNGEAADLLAKYESKLANSSMYLDLAGTVYSDIGLPEKAWPLYEKCNKLQPNVDLFQANYAACGVFLGKIEESRKIYKALLKRFPNHQRNHYQLARLGKAKDAEHIEQMLDVLKSSDTSDDKNIFMYFALGKELEDLERWQESFYYYKKGGDAVSNVAKYDIADDIALIDKIKSVCNADWLNKEPAKLNKVPDIVPDKKTPIFIVGLPRTGTTLTERIISNHSQVATIGETQFLQMVLRRESGVQSIDNMNADMIEALANKDLEAIAKGYIDSVNYRLGEEPFFIDKLPFNFLFLGFIAKAWPDARIIHLGRNPMDACFSMYKQIFTWAYKFSYSLDGLGRYYVSYDQLRKHWREVLQERLIEVDYESLVSDTENQTRIMLDKLGLNFEQDCLDFDKNKAPSATASSVQIREKAHSRSINKWQRFSDELNPLKEYLERAGIGIK
ncbi:MAG: tetratricopeptide (TPR) repeat protein [Alphaproteobacteria bacterium]|jgi:tetratricopeptide (TPR) repeat protein